MSSVVFLRGVNVGKANRCQPAVIAKELAKFGTINIGAVGTFVIRENASELILRHAFAKKLPFKCEIMICPAADIIELASTDPFSGYASGPEITRFVNVLAKPLSHVRSGAHRTSNREPQTSELLSLPICLPSPNDWLLKVIEIRQKFVLGLYRRQMKAIACLGKLEKILGVAATNRNWNTILKVAQILSRD